MGYRQSVGWEALGCCPRLACVVAWAPAKVSCQMGQCLMGFNGEYTLVISQPVSCKYYGSHISFLVKPARLVRRRARGLGKASAHLGGACRPWLWQCLC